MERKKRNYVNDTRPLGELRAHRASIISTDTVVYSAWEPSALMGGHHNITSYEGKWFGKVGTGSLPAALDALPAMTNDERYEAVHAWFASEYERAYDLIVAAFPESAAGERHDGEITMNLDAVHAYERGTN